MAISLALEVAEVLELAQSKNGAEPQAHLSREKEALGEELADVLYWVLRFTDLQNINLPEAFDAKMKKNADKYPIEKAKGRSAKYKELT